MLTNCEQTTNQTNNPSGVFPPHILHRGVKGIFMKKLLVLTAILVFASLSFGHATNIGYSGAPDSHGTCASSCHGTTGGTIQISGFPSEYVPGQTYTVTISHFSGSSIRQFNGSCRVGTGSTNAGTIVEGANTATYNIAVETNGIHLSAAGHNSGDFEWTAPALGTGTVRLYIAGMQGTTSSGQNTALVLVATEQVPAEMRKTPYVIYNGVSAEMEVHWQLTMTTTCTFEWGIDTTYAMGSDQTQEYGSDHQHLYTVPGLMPGIRYYYRVTLNQQYFTGTFVPAPADDATDLKFMVYGDTRSGPTTHNQIAEDVISTYTQDPDFQSFLLVTGDLVTDGNNETDWDDEFFNPTYTNIQAMLANLPYQACMGNDEGNGVLFEKYFPYPFVNDRYWSYDYGPAHIAVIDQYTDYSSGSAQLTWLENDLQTSDKLWKFICLHEPGWSAGGGYENNVNVQNDLQPIFESYGVEMVFAAHNHYYSRAVVNGIQHITTGGGGAPLVTPNPGYPNVLVTSMTNHFCKVAIDSNMLSFTAITPTGTVIDTFTIIHSGTFVDKEPAASPDEFTLSPAYPNPFNSSTILRYSVPRTENVTLEIFDILGHRAATLANRKHPAGQFRVTWDTVTTPSGIYFCRLTTPGFQSVQKMVLIK